MDPDRLTWALGGLVWLCAAGVLSRSRPTAVLGLLVGLAWLVGPAVGAGALWHRGPLIHLLLAAGSWWPRSRAARVVVIGGYALSASPQAWSHVAVAVIGIGAVLVAGIRERSARPLSPSRHSPWQAALALTALALLLPPALAWAGLDARWSGAVLIAYSVALSLVALLVVAALRPWGASWATDVVVDLGQEPVSRLWEELVPRPGDQDLVQAETQEAVRAGRMLRTRLAERRDDLTRALTETQASWERLAASDAVARMRLAGQITALTGERLTRVITELEQVTMAATGPAAMGAHRGGLHLVHAREQLDSLEQGLVGPALGAGLPSALRRLVAAAAVPVDLDLDVKSLADLPAETATTAYFVASEALTNAVKHAGAQRIRIRAQRRDGQLELTVVDDGRGGAAEDGGGVAGVRERVLEAGGRFDIASPARRGTEVRVVLPVNGQGER